MDVQSEDAVTCRYCFDAYKDPVTLPCGHSVCSACCEDLTAFQGLRDLKKSLSIQNSRKSESLTHSFACPTCGHSVVLSEGGVKGLTSNYELREVVERFVAARSASITCGICSQAPAALDCAACGCSQCVRCFEKLHEAPGLKVHQKAPLGETRKTKAPFCTEHQEPMKVYCTDCLELLCILCYQFGDSHRGHKCLPLKDYAAKCKADMTKGAQDLSLRANSVKAAIADLEQTLSLVKKTHLDIDRQVLEIFANLRKALDQRQAELLSASSEIRDNKVNALSRQLKLLTGAHGHLGRASALVKKSADGSDHIALAHAALVMNTLVKRFDPNDVLLSACESASLYSDLDASSLLPTLRHFGSITPLGKAAADARDSATSLRPSFPASSSTMAALGLSPSFNPAPPTDPKYPSTSAVPSANMSLLQDILASRAPSLPPRSTANNMDPPSSSFPDNPPQPSSLNPRAYESPRQTSSIIHPSFSSIPPLFVPAPGAPSSAAAGVASATLAEKPSTPFRIAFPHLAKLIPPKTVHDSIDMRAS